MSDEKKNERNMVMVTLPPDPDGNMRYLINPAMVYMSDIKEGKTVVRLKIPFLNTPIPPIQIIPTIPSQIHDAQLELISRLLLCLARSTDTRIISELAHDLFEMIHPASEKKFSTTPEPDRPSDK